MRIKQIWLIIVALILPLAVMAEDNTDDWMSPDRPGMATGVDVAPQGVTMLETGIECGHDGTHQITLPCAMVRFGLTDYAELRVDWDGALSESIGGHWAYNSAALNIGTKLKVFDGWKWIPKTSLMANLSVPCTKTMNEEMHVAPSLYALFSNDITDNLNVGYNVGAEWDGVSATPATFVAVCLGYSATDKLGLFLESYNYFTKEKNQSTDASWNLDFGLNYMLNSRVQLDLYSGFNLQHPKDGVFVGAGVAWRIR